MSENTQAVEQQETLVVETEDGPVRIDHVDLISKNDKIDMTLTVDMTPTTGLLLDAMAKAKAKMKTTSISKDAENTYFTNKQTGKAHSFATLDATLDFFTSAYAEFRGHLDPDSSYQSKWINRSGESTRSFIR